VADHDFRSRLVSEYPWISLDLLFAALLAALFLGYPGYGAEMQLMLRGLLVAAVWLFLISSWHLQVVVRHYEGKPTDLNIPWCRSLGFALLRLMVVGGFFSWVLCNGMLAP